MRGVPQNFGSHLMARTFQITADGGSRGNPGPAAYGAVVTENGKILHELYATIGIASNNVAEYSGLVAGLEKVHSIDPEATIEVAMDSKLVVEQMSGRWQIKHPDMRELAKRAREAHPAHLVSYKWIPRDLNSHADRLANKALDGDGAPIASKQVNFLTERVVSGEVPTTIYLVRHGETPLTPSRAFSGSGGSDPGLSEAGRAQAEAVAAELALRKPDVLIASLMQRTRETAEIIQKATGGDIHFDEAWREGSFGEWDGLTVAEVQKLYPSEWTEWVSSPFARPGSTGESYDDVAVRTEPALNQLAQDYPGQKVLVVTHNVVIKTLASLVVSNEINGVYHIDIAPCSITTIVIWPSDGLRALKSLSERSATVKQSHQ
jgi:probable phosphoglycerate mutase